MAACPKGHESETTDYCDVCGAAMAAARQPDPPAPAPGPAAARPAVCPECGTPMTGRFCEVDGPLTRMLSRTSERGKKGPRHLYEKVRGGTHSVLRAMCPTCVRLSR